MRPESGKVTDKQAAPVNGHSHREDRPCNKRILPLGEKIPKLQRNKSGIQIYLAQIIFAERTSYHPNVMQYTLDVR